jgi:hypothetical protein
VGPALRAHAHPPRQPGEPGRLGRPLAQPFAPWDTHIQLVFRIRIHLIRIRIQQYRLNTDPDPSFAKNL